MLFSKRKTRLFLDIDIENPNLEKKQQENELNIVKNIIKIISKTIHKLQISSKDEEKKGGNIINIKLIGDNNTNEENDF